MKSRLYTTNRILQTSAAFVLLATMPAVAYADPQGGAVIGGGASISSADGHTVIDQTSDRALIRWDSFDINAAEHVQFRQPSSSSITVNRITDSKASRIDGRLSANGNIVLINPNGMVFGQSAIVDVGGLVATSSDIEDDNSFLSGGAVKFTKPGNPDAKIVNNGTMTVREAGLAGLVAPHVENNGLIQARMGRVHLASGDIHTIDFAGDGLIKLEVSDNVTAQSIINRGRIEADGGEVIVTAAAARQMVDSLIDNSGLVRANTVAQQAGRIVLEGAKKAINTGTLQAEGDDSGEAGGSVTVLADDVMLGDGSAVYAAGDTHGGVIRIGGGYQGGEGLPPADTVYVAQDAVLNARSRRNGQGGSIVTWSEDSTRFYGHADARGGDEGGGGGFVEVSGKDYLDFNGRALLKASYGADGTLLLDPTNITINNNANAQVSGSSPFTPTGDDVTSYLNVTTLLNALANGNVIVQTRATGSQAGNITIDSALSWGGGNTLTLDAHNQVVINAAVNGGGLEIIAGGDVILNAAIAGTGTLTIQQRTDGTAIGIGASAVGVVNLSAADLSNIQDGWSNIILGRQTATAAMDIRSTTWTDNLTLRSGTGVINVNGTVSTGANNLTIITGGDINVPTSKSLGGTGILTITPSTTTTSVGLGGGAGNISLSATEIPRIVSTWNKVIIGRNDSTATITMGSQTWSDPLTILNGTGLIDITGVQTMGANALTFVTDGDIAIGVTNALYGSTTLTFETYSAGVGIGVGDSQAGTLNLTSTEAGRIRDGWASIVFGRTDGTAAINIGTTSWTDAVTFQTGSGAINVNATPTMGGQNLTLTTQGGNITIAGAISQTSGTITMNAGGSGKIDVNAGITLTTGNMSLTTAGGAINIAAALNGTTTGAWSVNSNNGAITIGGNVTRTGGSTSFNAGQGNVTVNNAIGTSAGSLSLTTGGAGKIAINNTLTSSTGAIAITTAGGTIETVSGATISQTTGNLAINSGGGAINILGALTQTSGSSGIVTINSNNGAIDIRSTLTRLAGSVSIDAGAGGFTAHDAVSLGAANATVNVTGGSDILFKNTLAASTGNIGLTTDGGDVTISAALSQSGAGNLSIATTGGAIATKAITQTTGSTTLESAGGTMMINGAISKTGGALVADSGAGQMTFVGAIDVGAGSASFTTDSNISFGGNLTGTGAFVLKQASDNVSLGLGSSEAGTLHLNDTELSYIQNGWSSRTFGRADSTAALNVRGGLTWDDSLVLQTGTGALNLNGSQTLGANGLTLRTDSNIHIGGNLSGTGAFSLVQATSGAGMGIGDGQAGAVHVSTAELGHILSGWSSRTFGRTDSTEAMNVGSFSWTESLSLRTGSGLMTIAGISMVAGKTLTIITDSDLTLNGNVTGSGSGSSITIYGGNAATSIGIGDGQAGLLQLSNTELTRLGTSWNNVYIGSTSATGEINVGGRSWSDPLTLRTGTGAININGVMSMGGNNLTVTTDADMTVGTSGGMTGTGAFAIGSTLAGTSYGLGNGQGGTISLSDDEITRINGSWSGVTIGTTTTAGSMNVGALTFNDNLTLRTGSGAMTINGAMNMSGNNLTLSTNSNLAIDAALVGTGTLVIQPSTSSVSMAVGTGQVGTLAISDGELARIDSGWTNVIFGTTSMTAALNVGGRNWAHSVDFRTNTGALNINGAQNMGDKNLTIRTNTNLAITQILAGTGTLSIMPSGNSSMGVGDGQGGTLNLSNAEMDMFKGYGWTTFAFGNTASTSSLNFGGGTWNGNLILRTAGSVGTTLNINGVTNVGANNVTLQSNNDIVVSQAIKGTGTLNIGQIAATVGLGIGNSQAGTVSINDAELALLDGGWSTRIFGITATTSGTYQNINIGANTWNSDVIVRSTGGNIVFNGIQNFGAHNLLIQTNANPSIGHALNGTGELTIQGYSASTSINVGGTGGTLSLSDSEVGNLGAGWSKLIFGRADGTGNMTVADRTWNNNVTLMNGTGSLSIAGADMGAKTLEIASNANLAINGDLDGTGRLIIRNAGGLNDIGVGAGQTGKLLLDATELGRIRDGWNNVQIGSASSFGAINIGAATWVNPMTFVTQGNIVINGTQTATDAGTNMVFATTGGKFINNAGANAIDAGPGRYLVYSIDENMDTIGDLLRPTILTNTSYGGYGPSSVTEGGNVYIYAGTAAKILYLVIDDVDKAYGDINPIYTYSYIAGLQNGDLLQDIVLSSSMSAAGSNVLDDAGTTRLINGSFNLGGGYTLNLITGTLTVVKTTVTVEADSDSREYGTSNPGLSLSYNGFRNGDDENSIASQATASTAATIFSNAGSYAITASGAADNNYNFIYVDGVLEITKAALTATVQSDTREYGENNPGFTMNYTGFRNTDNATMIDTKATASSVANALSNVGSYAITATGAVDNNYTFNYVNGTLGVTKATLTATTQNETREYGLSNPALNVFYTGFKNGQDSSVIDTKATVSTIATAASDVGAYDITASGASDDNYTFVYVNTGDLNITKAMLTVTADDKARIYGEANPGLTVSYTGFRNGQDNTVLLTQAAANTGATIMSDAGDHDIVASGGSALNYNFTYVDGTLAIGKATLTVTADSDTREYGEVDPMLGVTYSGFVNGDDELDIDTDAVATGPGVFANAGTRTVTASGGLDNNYTFNYVNGAMVVTKALLTATAVDAQREVGAANPSFSATYTGFKNGESSAVIDTLATGSTLADGSSPVGSYVISLAGATDNNYDFAYVDGTLTLTAATVQPPQPPVVVNPTVPQPPVAQNNLPSRSSIPVTAEDSPNTRHVVIPQTQATVLDMFQSARRKSGITVIADDAVYSHNDADNQFLIAITNSLESFEFSYADEEDNDR